MDSPVLLDLSAAFDTVDHELLQNIMSSRFGLSGRVEQRLQSYLSGRTQNVSINNQQSMANTLTCDVPQGSVVGPALFVMYTEDLGESINAFKVFWLTIVNYSLPLLRVVLPMSAAD